MLNGVLIGAIVGTSMGFGWATAGMQGMPRRWRGPMFAVALIVSALLGGAIAWRSHSGLPSVAGSGTLFNARLYWWITGLEAGAIFATALILSRAVLNSYIMPAIAFIVGFHFVAFAFAFSSRVFGIVGASICILSFGIICALARLLVSACQAMALTGFGCAAILWLFALCAVAY